MIIIKKMIKVANKLDSLGLTKEADVIDDILTKISSDDIFMKNKFIHNPDIFKIRKANEPEPNVDREQLISILKKRVSDFFGDSNFISVQNVHWTSDDYGNSFWNFDYVIDDDVSNSQAWLLTPEEAGIPMDSINKSDYLIKTLDGQSYIVYAEF